MAVGYESIRVMKDVCGDLTPTARAKVAEAMRSVLFDGIVPARPLGSTRLATPMASADVVDSHCEPVNRTFVGRPGLDPGTVGPKEGCISSDWSGDAGLVCEIKSGICVRSRLFIVWFTSGLRTNDRRLLEVHFPVEDV